MTVLVIGLGSMGTRRIKMLRRLLDGAQLFGVDSRADRCEQAQEHWDIQCSHDLDTALAQTRFDAAFVCTSPATHFPISKRLLQMGIPVFSELNLIQDGYDELSQLANRQNAVYFLSSTPLYRAEMETLCALTKPERALTYHYHVGQYLPDWHPWESYDRFFVGDRRTNGCRELFAVELPWLIGAFGDVTNVQVSGKRATDLAIQYHDTYLVIMTHERGNTGVLCVDVCCRKPVRHLEIYNQNLYLTWDGTPDSLYRYDLDAKVLKPIAAAPNEQDPRYARFIDEQAYLKETRAFLDCICGQAVPRHTLKKDKVILDLIDRIEGIAE